MLLRKGDGDWWVSRLKGLSSLWVYKDRDHGFVGFHNAHRPRGFIL